MSRERPAPVPTVIDLSRRLFPEALAVVLGGSSAAGRLTPTSDLDVVVVTPPRPAPYRSSLHWLGWPVEVLVHDPQTLAAYCEDNLARRWPGIPRLLAEGVVVTDTGGLGAGFRERMRARLAAGPAPLSPAELDEHRFVLTDLLDDLSGATDSGERAFVAWRALTEASRLALAAARHWQGSGKWLLRELRDLDPGLADRVVRAMDEPDRAHGVVREVLDRAGGPLWAGHTVVCPRWPGR
ncbi:nucleotidyltransferase domain-containing protein [Nocardiopsis tropica]|uniref:Nucleotidyltransferase domain-containing protein n=1 Tax=Nocardiopsis tropica TaxID=109330 RepID=A0ABU7KKH5_9ACTN|nr:nucleotidyltransferase domain-containing protein [Nocardiopsis umidischolae]MEE2049768.1 nucleotidyltransferase domain-containing protein [Nocardiopsis umidischolae]